jgi:hypothetical protein
MNQELLDRIDLIERMIGEGRRTTQYWGWTFVLWGVGQLIALAWSNYGGHPAVAWPVTMVACGVLTGIGSWRMHAKEKAETFISRALGAIWFSCGISISVLAFIGNPKATFKESAFLAVFFALMGFANFASGLVLRWRLQQSLGILWWAASAVAMLAPDKFAGWTFVGMDVVGEILFGLYLMAREKADLRHA